MPDADSPPKPNRGSRARR